MICSMEEQTPLFKEEEYFTSPKRDLLPPNQIITKKYSPDQNPILKLISIKQPNPLGISLDISKEERIGHFKYKVEFEDDDSLGYNLMQYIKKNLLYAKFDNRHFFYSPQNKCKYLAGLFISLNNLLKPELKQTKSFYKFINQTHDIQCFDYENSIENSFKSNCFSLDHEVKFSSNYQSSNLFMALKTGLNQYDLVLQNDINSRGTTQWFNFAVRFSQNGTYKFNIVNLSKSYSLFQKGMLIPFFSFQSNLTHNTGWTRGCQNISYSKSSITRQGTSQNYYFKLSFEYQNPHQNDTVIFSYCFPYTGLDLQRYFQKITQKKISNSLIFQRTKICETLSGFPVYVYHIFPKKYISSLNNLYRTPLSSIESKIHKNDFLNPKGIVFLARQHPGQSQSSLILEGIVDFLLENNEYESTKKNYHYYIFPMINVDGVYYGNYRTNLSGNDLNRIWKQPRKDFHPQIYSIKKYLYNANRTTQIKLIIDIHGHSSAFNSFFYGNPINKQGFLQLSGENPKFFPYYCSKQMKQINFLQCTFNLSEDKKGSARVVLNEMFPKANVYTLENSFFGYKKGKKVVQYTVQRYKKLGRKLMATYFEYSKITDRIPLIRQKWQKQIESIYSNLKNSEIQAQEDSDSEASQQLLEFEDEYDAIDNSNKSNQNDEILRKRNLFGDKNHRTHHRLYQRKKQKTLNNSNDDENKKNNLNRIYLQESPSPSDVNFASQLGFLSIVKIQTKSGIIQIKEKPNNSTQKNAQEKLFESESKENKCSEAEIQIQSKISKGSNCIERSQKLLKKQYNVRSIRQQNARVKENREIQYIDEKDFLMRKRKLMNPNKYSVGYLPNFQFSNETQGQFKVFGTRANNGTSSRPSEKVSGSRSYCIV